MITAIVFVKADVARIPEVGEAIAALDGVSEVYSVTGQIDLIALVRVSKHEDIAAVVADSLNKVDGVTATETHIAFRTFSRHDLESAFSLGSRLGRLRSHRPRPGRPVSGPGGAPWPAAAARRRAPATAVTG